MAKLKLIDTKEAYLMLNQSKSFQTKLPTKNRRRKYGHSSDEQKNQRNYG